MEDKRKRMIVTTTPSVEGRPVGQYLGIVSGEAIMGANLFKDMFAGIRDIVGGRSGAYEEELRRAKDIAMHEMTQNASALGADAISERRPRLRDGGFKWQHAHGDGERDGGPLELVPAPINRRDAGGAESLPRARFLVACERQTSPASRQQSQPIRAATARVDRPSMAISERRSSKSSSRSTFSSRTMNSTSRLL